MVEIQRKAAVGIGFTQETWDEGWSKSGKQTEVVPACAAPAVNSNIVKKIPSNATSKRANTGSASKSTPTPMTSAGTFTLENVGNHSAYDLRQELERRLGGTVGCRTFLLFPRAYWCRNLGFRVVFFCHRNVVTMLLR